MEADDPNIELMPGWRRAVRAFGEKGFKPGDLIEAKWLEQELGVERPDVGTADEFDRARLRWIQEFSRFHERIRDDRLLALRREGDAYLVMTASEQLAYAQAEGRRRLKNAMRWQADMLLTTDVNSLSDVERARHSDAMARMARLKSFARTLPSVPKSDELTAPKKEE
jgi:hypothetical protein